MKQINIIPFAKFHTIIFSIFGLFLGILYSFVGFIVDVMVTIGWVLPNTVGTPGLSLGTILAFGGLLGVPILFALVGISIGLIEALICKTVSKFIKIEMEFFK